MDINALIGDMAGRVGDLWFLALVGAFFVMICESAKPKPAEGETAAEPRGFGLLVMVLSLLTPLLLLVHAFYIGAGAPIAILAVIGGVILASAVIGWLIAAIAPPIGRTLNSAAPFMAVAVFALTAYVTWQSAIGFLNIFVAGGVR